MKKNLLKELILPAFWLFFFMVFSKADARVNEFKKTDITVPITNGIKKENISTAEVNNTNKDKEATFIKAIYLTGF